jgi:hypothetical protein
MPQPIAHADEKQQQGDEDEKREESDNLMEFVFLCADGSVMTLESAIFRGGCVETGVIVSYPLKCEDGT